jgi:pimeloyl-ACP methyl ester carboxylesterase
VAPGEIVAVELAAGGMHFDARAAGPEGGELVLLLHGFPETSYEWRAQLRALGAAGFRAVAPDQRGYSPGARPGEITDYALPLLVQDVLDMADALGAARFHVVGHDWGSAVAWAVAAAAPDRALTLSAISVPHPDAFDQALADPESCQWGASAYFDLFALSTAQTFLLANDAAQLRAIYADVDGDAIDEYVRALGSEEALGAALNWYRANVEDRRFTSDPVGPVAVPTLFIWSDEDAAVCRETAEAVAPFVTGPYRFEVISGVDHWVPELAADAVNQLLIEQLTAADTDARNEARVSPPLCRRWKGDACDVFHACGMMQAVDDCAGHAVSMCTATYLPPSPPTECEGLTDDDLVACVQSLNDTPCLDLTFESLSAVPGCALFERCFGWPM